MRDFRELGVALHSVASSARVVGCAEWDQWVLVAEADAANPHVALLRFTTEYLFEQWPLSTLLTNWLTELTRHHGAWLRVQTAERSDAELAPIEEIRDWIAKTRALVNRLPLSAALGGRMAQLAVETQFAINWPAKRFANPPTEMAGLLSLTVDAGLWAADTLRRAIVSSVGIGATLRRQSFDPLFAVIGFDPYDEHCQLVLKERLRRVNDAIIPGQDAALMSDVLDIMRAGRDRVRVQRAPKRFLGLADWDRSSTP